MGPILSALVNLQGIDKELREARKRLKKGQQAILKQQRRIEQLQAAWQAKHDEIKASRLQADRLELELKTQEAEIAKLRVALNTAKTNKDYSAILTRINTDKADKSKLEDQILRLMSQVEADQAEALEIKASIEAETQKLEDVRRETEARAQAIQDDVDRLEHQRTDAGGQVPPRERELFDRLAERYDGEVLVEINQKRNERNCDGCYMSLPLELVNVLLTKDEVVTCPSCGRILVLESEAAHGTRA